MKHTISLLMLSLLLTACNHRGKATVPKNLPGTWHVALASGDSIAFTIAPGGDFTAQIPTTRPNGVHDVSTTTGTFQVQEGYLIQTITNSSDNIGRLPIVARYKIIQMGDNEMVVVVEGTSKQMTLKKGTP